MRAEAAAVKEVTQYLTFVVADEEYAIAILRVREILAYIPLTRVPRAPDFITGVMNLRGSVVPVVDLRVKLGLPPTTVTGNTCIVVVEVEGEQAVTTMALLADEVKDVMELTDEEIEPAPSFGTRIDLSFLCGMGDLGDHFALILNVDKVLTTLELIAASQAVEDVIAEPVAGPDVPKKKSRRGKRAEA
jgi:purine-binding chemotaxis protein CheW